MAKGDKMNFLLIWDCPGCGTRHSKAINYSIRDNADTWKFLICECGHTVRINTCISYDGCYIKVDANKLEAVIDENT